MDFVLDKPYQMTCGSAEAESRVYHKVEGKNGRTWLYADQENAGDNVYVSGGPNSDGFGGRTLTFQLVGGGEIQLKGPWHSNSGALKADTGVDVTNQHRTWGVISRKKERIKSTNFMSGKFVDVCHIDQEPVVGEYNRIMDLAQVFADVFGEPVYYYSQSQGGSSSGQIKPSEKK